MTTTLDQTQDAARERLVDLASKLRALSDNWNGELRAEARLVLLLARLLPKRDPFIAGGSLTSPREVYDALIRARMIEEYIDTWSDMVEPRRGADPAERTAIIGQRERYEAAAFTVREYAQLHLEAESQQVALNVEKWLNEHAATLKDEVSPRDLEEERLYDTYVRPAQQAAAEAVTALCALADLMTGVTS